ncbi:hypothetical protein LCGC14_0485830 [marine sediment metagenome]|uniref:Uncharacterized protein n=1 Tax=marine sediment metagenome TaxID=412755 RepID=A0A0F9UV33_9ZZZZ
MISSVVVGMTLKNVLVGLLVAVMTGMVGLLVHLVISESWDAGG